MTEGDDIPILSAIRNLQAALRRIGAEPAIIELSCYEDGLKLKRMLMESREANSLYHFEFGISDNGPMNQVVVLGSIVRWPAQVMALRDGGFKIR